MGPEVFVLPVLAISQALGLSHRGEQLGLEEYIPEPAIERLGTAVLLPRAWLDPSVFGADVFVRVPGVERAAQAPGSVAVVARGGAPQLGWTVTLV
jgi:hypothetical protein